jgi:hypothetical protein
MTGFRLGVVLLIAAVLCGCSPQERLAHKIGEADQVVVIPKDGRSGATTIHIQGGDVQRLARAICSASATREEVSLENNNFADLEFWKGNKCLAHLQCGGNRYWIDGRGYSGTTGDLLDPRGGGPIHFVLSSGFRGVILLIRNAKGSSFNKDNAAYNVFVPADGMLSVSTPELLYSWPENASFSDGTVVPICADSAAPGDPMDPRVMLRSLGVFSANAVTYAAFYVGTQSDFGREKFDIAAVPRLPSEGGLIPLPSRSPSSPSDAAWALLLSVALFPFSAALAMLLGCVVLIRLLRQRAKPLAPVSAPIIESVPKVRYPQDSSRPYARPPLPYYRNTLLEAARRAVVQLPFLRRLRSKATSEADDSKKS